MSEVISLVWIGLVFFAGYYFYLSVITIRELAEKQLAVLTQIENKLTDLDVTLRERFNPTEHLWHDPSN